MKKVFILMVLFAVTASAMCQIKITTGGNMGIGTNTPYGKLHVSGNSLVSGNLGINKTSPIYNFDLQGTARFAIWGQGWDDIRLDGLNQWGAPQLYCNSANFMVGISASPVNTMYVNWLFVRNLNTISSDENLKEHIKPMGAMLNKLLEVEGKSYNYKKAKEEDKSIPYFEKYREKETFGFIAQELEKIFPELVYAPDSVNEYYSINYVGMIPVLVEVVKEQQMMIENLQKGNEPMYKSGIQNEWEQEIDTLKQEVASLREALALCCTGNHLQKTETDNGEKLEYYKPINHTLNISASAENHIDEMQLYQNVPNPFHALTTIKCYIPQTIRKVELCVYNMQGAQIKCMNIADRGMVGVEIQAGQLSAGVYTYLLIGDGKTSDAKQMILTK